MQPFSEPTIAIYVFYLHISFLYANESSSMAPRNKLQSELTTMYMHVSSNALQLDNYIDTELTPTLVSITTSS